MKQYLVVLLLFLTIPAADGLAQYTTVSAQVLDPVGQPYANCTMSASFVNQNTTPGAPPPSLSGSPFQTDIPASSCDASGHITLKVADNHVVAPGPSQWRFNVCSAQYTNPNTKFCFNWTGTITGSTQNITSSLQAVSAPLPGSGNFFNPHAPGPIGDVTPSTGDFTVLNGVVNAKAYASFALACAAVPGGEVAIPPGTYNVTADPACSTPTRWVGAGIGQTIIQPASLSTAQLFTFGSGEGWGLNDLTVDMTSVPTKDVLTNTTANFAVVENVRVIYPTNGSGTGKVINKTGGGGFQLDHLIVKGAGTCVYVQGDTGQEDTWENVSCESPSVAGYDLERTTTTDVGGEYLHQFRVTNPYAVSGAYGFKVNSTTINTAEPLFCHACISDANTMPFYAHNVNGVSINGNSWLRGSGTVGLSLDTVTEFIVYGGSLFGSVADLSFANTVTTVRLTDVKFANTAANGNVAVNGATLSGVDIIHPLMSGSPPMTVADQQLIDAAAPVFPYKFGGFILYSSDSTGSAMFRLSNDQAGSTNPNKFFVINNTGTYLIRDSANASYLWGLGDNGVVTQFNDLQMSNHAVLGFASLTPYAAGVASIGTTALPLYGFSIGSAANNTTSITSLATSNTSAMFPDKSGTVAYTSDITTGLTTTVTVTCGTLTFTNGVLTSKGTCP